MADVIVPEPTWAGGACAAARVGPDLFTSDDRDAIRAAKAVCASCPIREGCLRWALATKSRGVWGGLHLPREAPDLGDTALRTAHVGHLERDAARMLRAGKTADTAHRATGVPMRTVAALLDALDGTPRRSARPGPAEEQRARELLADGEPRNYVRTLLGMSWTRVDRLYRELHGLAGQSDDAERVAS